MHKGQRASQQRGSKCQGREARESLACLGNLECRYMTGMERGALGLGGGQKKRPLLTNLEPL